MAHWKVGMALDWTVYRDGIYVGSMTTAEHAREVVDAMNAANCDRDLPPLGIGQQMPGTIDKIALNISVSEDDAGSE